MNTVFQSIYNTGILPFLCADLADNYAQTVTAMANGGIGAVVVPCNHDVGLQHIKTVVSACPSVAVGALVLTRDQADLAISSGASFVVASGFNPLLISYCAEMGYLTLPGCATPTEIEQSLNLGWNIVNLFPVTHMKSKDYLKAMRVAYPETLFIPTGELNIADIAEYIAQPNVFACATSDLFNDAARAGDFDEVERIARASILKVLGFGLAHVGINCADYDAAFASAKLLCDLFGFAHLPGPVSVFSGTEAEFMQPPCRGTNGHIGFFTNSVPRAMAYLATKGIEFIEDSKRYTPEGALRFIYLKTELCGFALHLSQR